MDEDDGVRDGKYTGGYVWTNGGPSGAAQLRFTFSANDEGKLPEYVGVALLGGNSATTGIDLYSKILAYDRSGQEITGDQWLVLQPRVPPGTPFTSSLADRFSGISYSEGISRVVFLNNTLVDHLQYGYAIPEPGVSSFILTASTLLS